MSAAARAKLSASMTAGWAKIQGSKSEGGKAEKIIIGYPSARAGRRFGGALV
jgi:hypothetical protein